jgi:hypothetical protein
MKSDLKSVLVKIGRDYQHLIEKGSRHYVEVSLARAANELGFKAVEETYRDVHAIVPLKHPLEGMKVRIDGRTFVNYAQFESGIAVPPHIARQAGLPSQTYHAWDSMICNFS